MQVEFQKQQVSILEKSIKADYIFSFFPVNHKPVKIPAQVITTIPEEGLVSREDAIKAVLWEEATAKLEELEKNLPKYMV